MLIIEPGEYKLKYFSNLDSNQKKRTINYLRIFKNNLQHKSYKDAVISLPKNTEEVKLIESKLKAQKVFRDKTIKVYLPLNYKEIIPNYTANTINNSEMTVKKAKQKLIDAIIKETLDIINNSKKTNYYIKIGWIDFVSDDLIQYEIAGVCKGMENKVLLVHKDNSEGANKGDIYFMHQIKSIDTLEEILAAVKKNRNPLEKLFCETIPKMNKELIKS